MDWVDGLRLLLILGIARIIMGAMLYYTVGVGDTRRAQFINATMHLPYRWLYLVTTWDTAYYSAIANAGYPRILAPAYWFFPLYPFAIATFGLTGIDLATIAFVIALAAGLASVPLFLRIAKRCLSRDLANGTALLYFLLPPVFVFSGVSYSDSLLLLFCLLTWDSHLTGHDTRAGLVSALATLTRINGVILALPLAYNYVQRRQFRKLVYSAIAPLALIGWVLYGYWRTRMWFPMLAAESYFNPVDPTIQKNVLQLATGDIAAIKPLLHFWPIVTVGLTFTLFIVFLAYRAFKIDRALGLYAFVSITIMFAFGIFPAVRGFPRFFSFLFPVGLGLRTERRWVLVTVASFFLIFDYVLWWGLLGGWVT